MGFNASSTRSSSPSQPRAGSLDRAESPRRTAPHRPPEPELLDARSPRDPAPSGADQLERLDAQTSQGSAASRSRALELIDAQPPSASSAGRGEVWRAWASDLAVAAAVMASRGPSALLATPLVFFRAVKASWQLKSGERPSSLDFSARRARAEREFDAYVRVWRQALVAGTPPDPAPAPTVRPVVCVHGLGGHWSNWLDFLDAFEKRGLPAYARTLGRPPQSLDAYAKSLAEHIEKVLDRHPSADGIDVVAHSMGGITIRACLEQNPALRAKVRSVVTIGTPHAGTELARLYSFVPEASALKADGADLVRLPRLSALVPEARILTIASEDDLLVYPAESAHERGCERRTLNGLGHFSLLFGPDAIAATTDFVAEEPRERIVAENNRAGA